MMMTIGGCLFGQNEKTDTLADVTTDHSEYIDIVEVEEEESTDPDEPLLFAEEMPVFFYKDITDSNAGFKSYVADSIRIQSGSCHGKVFVQFVVERDSTVDNVIILRGLSGCEGYEKEVVRLLTTMPYWVPGRQNGVPARVKVVMPVEFEDLKI
jgi:periplasmic protein TonB